MKGHVVRTAKRNSTRVIQLQSGGTLTFTANMNALDLNENDRAWFANLITFLNNYQQPEQAKTAGAARVKK